MVKLRFLPDERAWGAVFFGVRFLTAKLAIMPGKPTWGEK